MTLEVEDDDAPLLLEQDAHADSHRPRVAVPLDGEPALALVLPSVDRAFDVVRVRRRLPAILLEVRLRRGQPDPLDIVALAELLEDGVLEKPFTLCVC